MPNIEIAHGSVNTDFVSSRTFIVILAVSEFPPGIGTFG
jgi:hypothetical protein